MSDSPDRLPASPPIQASPQALHAQGPSPVVGVLDSGVGGLSVLPALRQALPRARLLYVADSGWAPYGERDDDWIQARCLALAGFIREQGAGLMVMACNSATAAAAPLLRTVHAGWPIVGMEPGVKPAVLASPSGRVGVMATTATLRSQRYARLLADHGSGAQVFAQACTGLAMAIEQGNEPLIRDLVNEHTGPLLAAHVDTVVLGCTHYPFARGWIESSMGPGVHILDTADAVARRAASLILQSREDDSGTTATRRGHGLPKAITEDDSRPVDPEMRFWTSGEPAALNAFAQRWLGWSIKAEPLPRSAFAPGEAATNP